MKKIMINALPMTMVGTGIGRYLRGLSKAFEAEYRDARLIDDVYPRPKKRGVRCSSRRA